MKPKTLKREEGEERNAEWRKLSPVQQLEVLNRRLGVETGARKQRAKLKAVIQ